MNFDLLIGKIESVIADHLSEHGEEEMLMPYPIHWVICLSIADAAQDKYMSVRTVAPLCQPRYVSIGLLSESMDMINYGEPMQHGE